MNFEGLLKITDIFDAEGLVVVLECSPLCLDVVGIDGIDGVDGVFDRSSF